MEKFLIIILITIIGMKEISECCIESERNGLLLIKSSINPNSTHLSSWGNSNSDCCNWERVECNSTTSRITGLNLPGIIDFDSVDYWYLNASLFLPFQQLNRLSLQFNNIAGCIYNEGFERLSALSNFEFLDISSNKFNNSILQSLSGLSSLISLDLSDNELNGTINIAVLSKISSILQELNLGWNEIQGFETMEVKFIKLEYLVLRGNHFNKSIFPFIRDLSSLKTLYLNGNYFNQTLTNFLPAIERLSSLTTLALRGCGLSGTIPSSQGLCHLRDLVDLDLQDNDLNGNLPPCLTNLTSFEYLDLFGNQFTGDIVSSPIQNLTSLQFLDLSHNLFHIPISLAPLFNHFLLKVLYVDNNTIYADAQDLKLSPKFQLEIISFNGYGEGGTLPKFLYHQHNLEAVYISSIKLRDMFPYWILENNTRLCTLDLSNNFLSGNLQLPYNPHVNLSYLSVSNNSLSGYIPSQIGVYFPSLVSLRMSGNELMGTIPDSACNITALNFLDISKNKISGTIPICIGKLSELQILDLSSKNIFGSLPSNIGQQYLIVVNLSKNRLRGSLGDAFKSCGALILLDLSHNRFSGNIPSWIGELYYLSFLFLGYNNLTGEIPARLCKLKRLSFIDLSHNEIVGPMLPCLNFTSYWSREQTTIEDIEYLGIRKGLGYRHDQKILSYTQHIDIVMKGHIYTYEEKVLSYVSGIDISSNNLTGQIPFEIGDLRSIKTLNLSQNCFTGIIPLTFSNLKEIESLDLSFNHLQGTIPRQLTQLTSLTISNVLYNNLSGSTPNQVEQFATFDESSYRGNPFLCGWPLTKSCGALTSPPSNATISHNDDKGSNMFIDMEDFFVSFGVTYVVVLLTLVAVLCINPYWRSIWFYYVQMYFDMIYYFIVDNIISLFSRF